jgi:hypothetical protein
MQLVRRSLVYPNWCREAGGFCIGASVLREELGLFINTVECKLVTLSGDED